MYIGLCFVCVVVRFMDIRVCHCITMLSCLCDCHLQLKATYLLTYLLTYCTFCPFYQRQPVVSPRHRLSAHQHSLFSVPPVLSALLSFQFGSHSLLALTLVHHHTPSSMVCLKPTVSSRPSLPHSCSHKCL